MSRSHLINTSVAAAAIQEPASSALSRVLDGLKGHLYVRSGGFLASSRISPPSRRSIYEMASRKFESHSENHEKLMIIGPQEKGKVFELRYVLDRHYVPGHPQSMQEKIAR